MTLPTIQLPWVAAAHQECVYIVLKVELHCICKSVFTDVIIDCVSARPLHCWLSDHN